MITDIPLQARKTYLLPLQKIRASSQLDDFVKQMKAKGIELRFENINYNDGILTEISGYMKSNDGRSNFVATRFQ